MPQHPLHPDRRATVARLRIERLDQPRTAPATAPPAPSPPETPPAASSCRSARTPPSPASAASSPSTRLRQSIPTRIIPEALDNDFCRGSLAEIERRLGLAERLACRIEDPRAPDRVHHGLAGMIRFRALMIAAGYADAGPAGPEPGALHLRPRRQRGPARQGHALAEDAAMARVEDEDGKDRRYGEFPYAARTWMVERHVIARVEGSAQGSDNRFVVTNLKGAPSWLYEDVYCPRGQAENLIKAHKLHLASDRTSCSKATANQFRLLVHTAAYWLLHTLRGLAPKASFWRDTQFDLRVARGYPTRTALRAQNALACDIGSPLPRRGVRRNRDQPLYIGGLSTR